MNFSKRKRIEQDKRLECTRMANSEIKHYFNRSGGREDAQTENHKEILLTEP